MGGFACNIALRPFLERGNLRGWLQRGEHLPEAHQVYMVNDRYWTARIRGSVRRFESSDVASTRRSEESDIVGTGAPIMHSPNGPVLLKSVSDTETVRKA
jgi:hypothetical protein